MTSVGMKRGMIQTHLLSDVTMTRRTAGSMKGVPEQKGSEIYAMGIRTGPRRWTKCYAYSFEYLPFVFDLAVLLQVRQGH